METARKQPWRTPITPNFRFVHEPRESASDGIPFVGDDTGVMMLRDRIAHSHGGALLVTGYRGVGKTTTVLRALSGLPGNNDPYAQSVCTVLNVARPIKGEQLLFMVMRRVFEAFRDQGVLELVSDDVRREVTLAYARTSLSMSQSNKQASERGGSITVGAQLSPLLGNLGPNVGISRSKSEAFERQASFLAYTEADVEHDFLRIVELLRQEVLPRKQGSRRHWWSRRERRLWDGRLVVVLDELDKLTAHEDGVGSLEVLLSRLKNVLTASGTHFIFVGGPDLHELYIRDARKGNGIYESVFSFHLYVPCTWGAAQTVVGNVLDSSRDDDPEISRLTD